MVSALILLILLFDLIVLIVLINKYKACTINILKIENGKMPNLARYECSKLLKGGNKT